MTRTLQGPEGMTIELDSDEIVPDNPGAGTPAMVYCRGYGASFFAVEQGCDLMDHSGDRERGLSPRQAAWIEEVADEVYGFIQQHGG